MKQDKNVSTAKDWWIEFDFYGRALFCFISGKKTIKYPTRYISQAFKLNCYEIIRPDPPQRKDKKKR